MNPICTNPYHEEMIQEGLQLIGQFRFDEALNTFLATLNQLPDEWEYLRETPDSVHIAFWDVEEYTSYEEYRKKNGLKKPPVWLRPSYSQTFYSIAYLLVEKRQFLPAMEIIDKLIEIEPDHPSILYEKGLIHSHLKEPEKAIESLQNSLFLRPWVTNRQKARSLRGLGVAYIELNQLDQAEVVLRKSLQIEPMNELALNELLLIMEFRKGLKLSDNRLNLYHKTSNIEN